MNKHILYESDYSKKKEELQIAIPEIKVYSYIAFPMSIICTQDNSEEWIYSNYINVYSRYDAETNFLENRYDVQFFEDENYFLHKEMLSNITFKSFDLSIVEGIILFINNQRYVAIYLDEYYIDYMTNYKKEHLEHEVLIYGYDIDDKYFKCISYGSDQHYRKRIIRFNDLLESFKNEKIDNGLPLILFSFYDKSYRPDYKADIHYIMHMIQNYIYSKNFFLDRKKMNKIDDCNTNAYGINIFENFELYLHKLVEMNKSDLQKVNLIQFYFLYENKKLMFKRLTFLQKQGVIGEKENIEYKKVVDESRNTLNVAIKYNVIAEKKRNINQGNQGNKFLFQIIDQIKIIKEKERDILTKVVEEYDRKYINKSNK